LAEGPAGRRLAGKADQMVRGTVNLPHGTSADIASKTGTVTNEAKTATRAVLC